MSFFHSSNLWLLHRFTAVWLFFSFFFFLFFGSFSFPVLPNFLNLVFFLNHIFSLFPFFCVLTSFFLSVHIFHGAESILLDYVHHTKTQWLCCFLITCVLIFSFKYFYIFVIF